MKKIFILFTISLLLTSCAGGDKSGDKNMEKQVRQAAFAGQFYPGDAARLEFKIKQFLDAASSSDNLPHPNPPLETRGGEPEGQSHPDPFLETKRGDTKAIIVPHAGYDYSGKVAAAGYKQIEGKSYNTVFIMCNSHAAYFNGIALDDSDAWQTPLGEVAINKEIIEKLVAENSLFNKNLEAHLKDHTIEVQLPFLQIGLKTGFKIVPISFGAISGEDFKKAAETIAQNLGDNDLIVVSSDMSHYPKYEDANLIDRGTLDSIAAGDAEKLMQYINSIEDKNYANEETLLCGIDGVKTTMAIAKIKSWNNPEILKYQNSGDASIGTKDRVVGYGAVAFSDVRSEKLEVKSKKVYDDNLLTDEQKMVLTEIATTTVESFVRNREIPEFKITDERLNKKQGAFVTLHKNGQLRGCIGQIVPGDEPLWQVVRDMAIAAATEDPRFSPVSKDELQQLEYEISVLSVPEQIDDWRKIELGKHGVIVKNGWRSGVFLPQVATETGWNKETFLSELCTQKAGLESDCYKSKSVELQVFSAQVFN